jgi:hypothetical protein
MLDRLADERGIVDLLHLYRVGDHIPVGIVGQDNVIGVARAKTIGAKTYPATPVYLLVDFFGRGPHIIVNRELGVGGSVRVGCPPGEDLVYPFFLDVYRPRR